MGTDEFRYTSGGLPLHAAGQRPRVVIVGAGFGGLSAAQSLASADIDLTVIDRNNYHLFQPLLYQVATAGLSPSEIAYPIRTILRRWRNIRVMLGEVTGVDLDDKRVHVDNETISYDYLIVAAGARHSYFGHPEWEENAPGLKSIEDAFEIRRRVLLAFEHAEREPDAERRRAFLTFVVVGGGPTGVELAGAIAEIACQVLPKDFRVADTAHAQTILVEAGPRILSTFPPELSARAAEALRRRCVDVRTGATVERIESGRVTIAGQSVATETVLWAAGVTAASITRTLGLSLDGAGRVMVNSDLRVAGRSELFVIGDAAATTDAHGTHLPGLAPVAIQAGRHAALSIRAIIDGRQPRAFVYSDRGIMATIGRGYAVASTGSLRLSGYLGWLAWLFVHILWLVGFRSKSVVLIEWAWAYLANQRSGRLILSPFRREQSGASRVSEGGRL
jgi:NADH dehydrogenase